MNSTFTAEYSPHNMCYFSKVECKYKVNWSVWWMVISRNIQKMKRLKPAPVCRDMKQRILYCTVKLRNRKTSMGTHAQTNACPQTHMHYKIFSLAFANTYLSKSKHPVHTQNAKKVQGLNISTQSLKEKNLCMERWMRMAQAAVTYCVYVCAHLYVSGTQLISGRSINIFYSIKRNNSRDSKCFIKMKSPGLDPWPYSKL